MIINISENQSGHEETGSSKLQCEKNNILLVSTNTSLTAVQSGNITYVCLIYLDTIFEF